MSRESAFLVSSQNRTTSAPSAYATHLLLFISPIDSTRLAFCMVYVVPATLNDVLRFRAPTQSSRDPGTKESVSAPGESPVKQSMSLEFCDGTWHIDVYVCPDSARSDVVRLVATSESAFGSRPVSGRVCKCRQRICAKDTRHQDSITRALESKTRL